MTNVLMAQLRESAGRTVTMMESQIRLVPLPDSLLKAKIFQKFFNESSMAFSAQKKGKEHYFEYLAITLYFWNELIAEMIYSMYEFCTT